MRNLLREFLTDEGLEVDTAVDGDEGIAKALSGDYSLVFCDLHMPRKLGYQVYEQVHIAKPDMKFVFTDSMPDAFSEQLADTGQFFILRKPFDLKQIRNVLASLIPGTVRHATST